MFNLESAVGQLVELFSTLSPDSFYLLRPCSRVCLAGVVKKRANGRSLSELTCMDAQISRAQDAQER